MNTFNEILSISLTQIARKSAFKFEYNHSYDYSCKSFLFNRPNAN